MIEDEDIDKLVACCPYVAQQIFAHNDLREEFCE